MANQARSRTLGRLQTEGGQQGSFQRRLIQQVPSTICRSSLCCEESDGPLNDSPSYQAERMRLSNQTLVRDIKKCDLCGIVILCKVVSREKFLDGWSMHGILKIPGCGKRTASLKRGGSGVD